MAAMLFALSLLSGCKAESANNVQHPAKAQESSGNMTEPQQSSISVEVYPIDLNYKEYVNLVISDELPITADPTEPPGDTIIPKQPEEASEGTTFSTHQTEPTEEMTLQAQMEKPAGEVMAPTQSLLERLFSGNINEETPSTKRPDGDATITVFRYRETDMAVGSVIFRIQVQKLEDDGLTVFFGTLYPGEKVEWAADEDSLLQAKLTEALLGDIQWKDCVQTGVYAHNQIFTKCVVCGPNVIYTNADSTLFQFQSYHTDGSLQSVAELAQSSAQLLLNGSVETIVWSEDPYPIMSLTVEEQPVYDDTALREQNAVFAEQIGILSQKIAEAEKTICVLYVAAGVLVASNLICLLLLLRRKKRHAKQKKHVHNAEPEKQVAETIRSVGTLHNIGGRSGQQDSFDVINCSAGTLAVVADGMGGLVDGDKVSQKIVATMRADSAKIRPGKTDSVLCQMVAHANQEVNRMLGVSRQYKCGSTLLAVLVEKDTMQWITVGDSRIYLYRGGKLIQINREHIYCAELLEHAINGRISFTEALRDPQAERLSSFVGMGELKHVDICLNRLKLCAGDHILLMSDGVFNTLTDEEIAETIKTSANASDAASILEEKVLKKNAPNQDNFTCVILEV